MGNQQHGFIPLLQLVQQVIDPLCHPEHGFPGAEAVDELCLGGPEGFSVPGGGFIYPEILLRKPGLRLCGDAGDPGNMPGGFRCPDQRRVKNPVNLPVLRKELLPEGDCLLMAKLRQGNIRCAADLVFHIPHGLTVPGKIHCSHFVLL